MKAMGSVLILIAAAWAYASYRQRTDLPLRLGRAILSDLSVLRWEVCVRRSPLPDILACLGGEESNRRLWQPVASFLRQGDGAAPECWDKALRDLPPELTARLMPLGPLLSVGGETLAKAIDETREELMRDLRPMEAARGEGLRLAAAVCFSSASLLILILL